VVQNLLGIVEILAMLSASMIYLFFIQGSVAPGEDRRTAILLERANAISLRPKCGCF
jgi:hypothetical protein